MGKEVARGGRPEVAAPRRELWIAWGLAAAWAAVVLGLGGAGFSSESTSRILGPLLRWLLPDLDPASREALHHALRKIAHVVEYAVLAALALRAALLSLRSAGAAGAAALALGVSLAVASLDEAHQAALEHRTGTPRDIAFDMAGAALGTTALLAVGPLRRRATAR